MNKPFHEKRRQQFLTEKYYLAAINNLNEITLDLRAYLSGNAGDADDKRGWSFYLSDDAFRRFCLNYTAGAPMEQLRTDLTGIIEAYEQYQKALEIYEQIPHVSPLGLDQLADYERCMQLIGLCILLHRPDLLNRLSALIDPGYKGEDTLYEDLLAFYQPGRIELDEWYHAEPYTPLVHTMYEEDKPLASKMLLDYCKRWYPAFKYVPWHDGHLRIDGTDGDYFGYWAFEAGAVAYLLDLDDTDIDHLVYPKDLVAWARANKHLTKVQTEAQSGRCEAGQLCQQTGYWFTPAQANARRYFKAGDIMPTIGSDYGTTIWQWDSDQSSNPLTK